MPEMTLKIKTNEFEKEVGKLLWSLGPGETGFDIPFHQRIDEETYVVLSGLQYYDFSMFVVLLEVINSSYGSRFYLVDSEKINKEAAEVYLPELLGGYKEFNKIAADYVNGKHMKPITVYDDVEVKVLEMSEHKEYVVLGDKTEYYERIVFKKKEGRIFVTLSGNTFESPYEWNFDLSVIDLLTDDSIEIDKVDCGMKRRLIANPIEKATIENLVVIEYILNSFFAKFEELPKVFRRFVRLPH